MIASALVPFQLKKGKTVIHQRTRGGTLFMVRSGEFKVVQTVRGKQRELGVFRSGDHFGELAFIDGKPRSATIVAMRNSELLALRRGTFDALVKQEPGLHIKLLHALVNGLCAKLRERHSNIDADLSDLLPVTVFEIDLTGEITFANKNGLKFFRYSDTDFDAGLKVIRLFVRSEQPRLRKIIADLAHSGTPVLMELPALRKDGTTFPSVTHWEPLLKENQPAGARATIIDISERKQMEEALRLAHDDLENKVRERTAELAESEERYALAVDGANDGLWDWNLLANEIYYSPRWKSMLGYENSEIGNAPEEWFKRLHNEDLKGVETAVAAHRDQLSSHVEIEYRILHKDGSYRWMLCRGLAVKNKKGITHRMAGSQTDITDRKRLEEQLIRNAFYDALTNLPNRALFMDRLGWALERARQYERTGKTAIFAVLYLDMDRFKYINDSYGHASGDQLLNEVAKRLQMEVRPGDTVARMGGDEFAILLDQIRDRSDSTRVATRILKSFSLPFNMDDREIFISGSIGIAFSTRTLEEKAGDGKSRNLRYETPLELLRDADTAMYRAKSLGGARYQIFETDMHRSVVAALELETDLRRAIEREEHLNYYQPIVSLTTGSIVGFEALVRWKHAERGLVLPSSFIGAAENTGLIVPLGQNVLKQACRQIYEWNTEFPQNPPLYVAVNVSGKQLMQEDFLNSLEDILQQTGVHRDWLKLEITESIMMENRHSIIDLMTHLRSLGLRLGLDDFGTGYSSLSSLRRFPIETLKIDRSFIREMQENSGNLKIVRTIIALANSLEMKVVAEGVEEAGQLALLRELNCDHGQGYFFAKPLASEDAGRMLRDQPKW